MKRAIKNATQAEKAYQASARDLGCVVCLFRIRNGYQDAIHGQCGATHIHHRNTGDYHGQKQLGQGAVVALGAWHHDGVLQDGMGSTAMRAVYGPSFKSAADFREWTYDVLPDYPGRGTERWQALQDEYLRE